MILDQIVATTRGVVASRKVTRPLAELAETALARPPARDFAGALRQPGIAVIAEIKRASPSKGILRGEIDAAALAKCYEENGATAISVLTEPEYFRGSLADLAAVRAATELPILRKDFLIDPYQVYETRALGADAFLLIVAVLDNAQLAELLSLGRTLGMAALVEVHEAVEVERALAAGAEIVGINNRNLADFSVDLETTPRLRRLIPRSISVVGESGIHSATDVAHLMAGGVQAVLVGEALVTSADPGAQLRALRGV